MIHKIFSIFDAKMQSYGDPFYSPNLGSAERTFSMIFSSTDPDHQKSPMLQFPQDFHLYCIGEFDTDTGEISGISHVSVASGNQFLNKAA
jgi:hypothetical protein